MSDVNVRELRQNLSVYLRRVEAGEALRVMSRGRPVAMLSPLREEEDLYARMIREGRLTPASRPWSDIPPPLPAGDGPLLSEILDEVRADRI